MMWDKRYIIAAVVLLFLVGGGVVALTDRHVTVTHEGEGTVSPEGDFTMKFYEDMELDVEPAEGWHVGAILVEGEPIEYDGSHTISIHFLDLTHTHVHVVFVEDGEPVPDKTLKVTSEGMGSVSPGGVTEHLDGERVTVTATPVEGYSVVSFVVDGIDKGPITSYDVIMDGSHEVHVVFNHYLEPHYTLMVFREGSGTTDPVDITHHDFGAVVDVRFIPDHAWKVGSVDVDGVDVGSPDRYSVTMDRSHIIRVTFVSLSLMVPGAIAPVSPGFTYSGA